MKAPVSTTPTTSATAHAASTRHGWSADDIVRRRIGVSIVRGRARVTVPTGDPRARPRRRSPADRLPRCLLRVPLGHHSRARARPFRSEEHTSELQSHHDLVCRLLLEKKKKKSSKHPHGKTQTAHTTSQ